LEVGLINPHNKYRGNSRGQDKVKINGQIMVKEVRLIDEKGTQLGIKSTAEALALAKRVSLDLVEIPSKTIPPVCKIMDYGKYKYEFAKKEKENRKKQKNLAVKELKFRIKIDIGDFTTKVEMGKKFLQAGHRLKILIMFRGREVVYKDKGYVLQDKIIEALSEFGNVERKGRLEGHNINLLVAPKNT